MVDVVLWSMWLDNPSGPEAVLTFMVHNRLCTSSGRQVILDRPSVVAGSGAVSVDVTGENHEEKCDANKLALLKADSAQAVKTGGTLCLWGTGSDTRTRIVLVIVSWQIRIWPFEQPRLNGYEVNGTLTTDCRSC